jgi:hypothetical protein
MCIFWTAGTFGVELIGGESLEDVDEGELDGRGVLERREVERCGVNCRSFAPLRMTLCGSGTDGIGAVVDGLDVLFAGCG